MITSEGRKNTTDFIKRIVIFELINSRNPLIKKDSLCPMKNNPIGWQHVKILQNTVWL